MPYRIAAPTPTPRGLPEARPDDARHARRATVGIALGLAGSVVLAVFAAEVASRMPASEVEIEVELAQSGLAFDRVPARILPVTALVFPLGRPGPEWGASADIEGSRFAPDGTRIVFHYLPESD